MDDKTKEFIRQNLCYLAVAVVSLTYVATAFIKIEETGKSVSAIIADGAISFFLGLFITRLLDMQGISLGDKDPKMISTRRLHDEAVMNISAYIGALDEWCMHQNEDAIYAARIKILASAGMKYEDYFDGNTPKPFKFKKSASFTEWLYNIKRYKVYKRALKPKITLLNSTILTSEGGRITDGNYLGMTKAEYETATVVKDLISKIAVAMLFGYYGVEMLADFSPALLIWRFLQVCMFLVMGVIKMYRSYSFVIDEYRGRIIKIIHVLQKFNNDIQRGIKNGNQCDEQEKIAESKLVE